MERLKQQKKRRDRVLELDALRGLALVMMVLHHLIADLRHLFGLDVFALQDHNWFIYLLRPVFLNIFIVVSGISCTFSRSNSRRGFRLLAFSLFVTLLSWIISSQTGFEIYIYFNILHVLSVGILLYALLTRKETRTGQMDRSVDIWLLLLGAVFLWASSLLPVYAEKAGWLLLPFGLPPENTGTMADYLPLVPWLGFFLLGALFGRHAYKDRGTAFPNMPAWLQKVAKPLALAGRHSLLIYALHQPIILAVLFGLRFMSVI